MLNRASKKWKDLKLIHMLHQYVQSIKGDLNTLKKHTAARAEKLVTAGGMFHLPCTLHTSKVFFFKDPAISGFIRFSRSKRGTKSDQVIIVTVNRDKKEDSEGLESPPPPPPPLENI